MHISRDNLHISSWCSMYLWLKTRKNFQSFSFLFFFFFFLKRVVLNMKTTTTARAWQCTQTRGKKKAKKKRPALESKSPTGRWDNRRTRQHVPKAPYKTCNCVCVLLFFPSRLVVEMKRKDVLLANGGDWAMLAQLSVPSTTADWESFLSPASHRRRRRSRALSFACWMTRSSLFIAPLSIERKVI